MEGIITTPTDNQKKDFVAIVDPSRKKSVQEEFEEKLSEEQQKATKKGLPFCDRAARDDFKEGYEDQAKKSMKQYGFVKRDDIKPVKLNWAKYSDLKNFEVIEEGETYDRYLTRVNPGLEVYSKKTVYKFNGYSNKYTIMEDGPSSLRRARQRLKELG
jgi:hypothetical protein